MTASAATTRSGRPFSFSTFLETYGSLLALVALVIIGAIESPDFLRVANIANILRQSSAVGVIAIGMTFVIILGGIDLSVGSMVALLGGLGFWAMEVARQSGASDSLCVFYGAAVMLLGGPLLGCANGLLITKGRVTPFVATLGAMASFRSICLAIADGGEFRAPSTPSRLTFDPIQRTLRPVASALDSITGVFHTRAANEPGFFMSNVAPYHLALVFIVVALVGHVVLKRTRFGYYVRAVGDNAQAATYSAVRIDRIKILTYVLSGAVCGIAAVMASSRMNSVSSSQTGSMYELDAIAAVVVGGTRMQGGAGRIWSTVVGVLILGVISNLLNMLNSDELKKLGEWLGWSWLHLEKVSMSHLQGLVKGTIIVAAVLLQRSAKKT